MQDEELFLETLKFEERSAFIAFIARSTVITRLAALHFFSGWYAFPRHFFVAWR